MSQKDFKQSAIIKKAWSTEEAQITHSQKPNSGLKQIRRISNLELNNN
jgi:hypothetical protein